MTREDQIIPFGVGNGGVDPYRSRQRVPCPIRDCYRPDIVTHVNLNDGVVEGLRLLDAPAFSVQYHPEAAPGPHDAAGLFAEFCELMERAR